MVLGLPTRPPKAEIFWTTFLEGLDRQAKRRADLIGEALALGARLRMARGPNVRGGGAGAQPC